LILTFCQAQLSIRLAQDLNPRKNPVDVTASDEHNQYPKRQQTSGAFAEASMV